MSGFVNSKNVKEKLWYTGGAPSKNTLFFVLVLSIAWYMNFLIFRTFILSLIFFLSPPSIAGSKLGFKARTFFSSSSYHLFDICIVLNMDMKYLLTPNLPPPSPKIFALIKVPSNFCYCFILFFFCFFVFLGHKV